MPLPDLFGITLLTDEAFQPEVPSEAIAGTDLDADSPAIVVHLKDYLLLHHPTLHEKLTADHQPAAGIRRSSRRSRISLG